jgi:guanosine-3',5'-bis(diphosphate) 3'-pyrophosphohydrolase
MLGVKPETIEKEFGKEVLFLIEGVTKLGHLKYHGTERHRESLRKLLVATGKDVRVLDHQVDGPPPQHAHARACA